MTRTQSILRAVRAVVSGRLRKLNDEANKAALAGKEPHPSVLCQQDRAAYLLDELDALRDELGKEDV